MSRLVYIWQQSWLVIVAAFCSGLLMAATNAGLSARITSNKNAKMSKLMSGLLPQASAFERLEQPFELVTTKGRLEAVDLYKASDPSGALVGWVFVASGQGFSDKIELIVAVDKGFERLAGFRVLACSETPGFGDKIRESTFQRQFEGAPAGDLELVRFGDPGLIDRQIVAITGATVSSNAVVSILNMALDSLRMQMKQKGLLADGSQ